MNFIQIDEKPDLKRNKLKVIPGGFVVQIDHHCDRLQLYQNAIIDDQVGTKLDFLISKNNLN